MKTQKFLSRAALSASVAPMVIGIAMVASPAYAQAASEEATAEEIVVTGSRIPQPNLESVSPVTVVSPADLKLQGTTRVEDLLNSLPQVAAGQAGGVSNGASGIATVDLRGLGSVRTLVLVNGRRLLPGDPTDSSADLNAIPDSLIKRIDVLTGGASSTYGADAVSGVVNFIMDTDFTGIQLDTQYGFYQHNNRNQITPPLLKARQAQGFSGYGFPTGSVADGGLRRGIPIEADLEARLPQLGDRHGSAVNAREQTAALQLAEVTADGHVTNPELVGGIGHAHETTRVDQSGELLSSGFGHAFGFFRIRNPSFRYRNHCADSRCDQDRDDPCRWPAADLLRRPELDTPAGARH